MDGSIASDAIVNIHNRRALPMWKRPAREIANLCRGVLRDAQNGVFLDIGQMTFRGDGKIRYGEWQALLKSPEMARARRIDAQLHLAGRGG